MGSLKFIGQGTSISVHLNGHVELHGDRAAIGFRVDDMGPGPQCGNPVPCHQFRGLLMRHRGSAGGRIGGRHIPELFPGDVLGAAMQDEAVHGIVPFCDVGLDGGTDQSNKQVWKRMERGEGNNLSLKGFHFPVFKFFNLLQLAQPSDFFRKKVG